MAGPDRTRLTATEASEACSAGSPTGAVVAFEEAAARVMGLATAASGRESLPLSKANGRVLAEAVSAPIALPPFSNSAMDGYAVRLRDLVGSGPWLLPVTCEVPAGCVSSQKLDGCTGAVRIFTGAPLPAGYDAVVMQEHCRRVGGDVSIEARPRQGANIRHKGEDISVGGPALCEGQVLDGRRLALLAGLGRSAANVFSRLRVGIISTGDELVEPGQTLAHGQIFNSNRPLLAALLGAPAWVDLRDFGIVRDREADIAALLAEAVAACDVVITTGGISAGDHDHVAAGVARIGGGLDVLRVAMRPGKPLKVGRIGRTLFIGLPGNPLAAMVTFHGIALPAIRLAAGMREDAAFWVPAVSSFELDKKQGRTEFVPVRVEGRDELGRPILTKLGRGSSGSLTALAAADGFAVLPPEAGRIAMGMPLRFEPLTQR